ncbi:MAG: thioredoxin family protein [Alphaproteobacteria bacterium]|nr:thioredoxin family protein [Alphaproteobacteria bacterium]
MQRFAWFSVFIIGLIAALPAPKAARNVATVAAPAANLQLVVLEVPGCIYCGIFRRQLLPNYKASKQGRKVPVRFVDLNDPALGEIGLTQPVGVVPTFVVLENNQEIGRIPGYVSHHDFFKAIDHILAGR